MQQNTGWLQVIPYKKDEFSQSFRGLLNALLNATQSHFYRVPQGPQMEPSVLF